VVTGGHTRKAVTSENMLVKAYFLWCPRLESNQRTRLVGPVLLLARARECRSAVRYRPDVTLSESRRPRKVHTYCSDDVSCRQVSQHGKIPWLETESFRRLCFSLAGTRGESDFENRRS
jgi:hypothetical protein